MRKLKAYWRNICDVRPGECLRTLFMCLHILLVLLSYYILKPLAKALFLNNFDIDKLPHLIILIAVAGGLLAYVYTKLAVRASLRAAVSWTTGISIVCLVTFWWILGPAPKWVYYAFPVWVSLFSIVLVSQGWLVASNVFDTREAKRLYALVGLAAILGAALSSLYVASTAKLIVPRYQLLISAAVVILAYIPFRLVIRQKGVSLAGVKAAEAGEAEVHLRDIASAIGRYRHLQVIIGIIALMLIVDVLVDFQMSYMAKLAYQDAAMIAFQGRFNLFQNILTIALQLFLTALIVNRLQVGGTLQIMPVTMAAANVGIFVAPGIYTTVTGSLLERASRYSFNRTGMELLYMPLPLELRNRTKAFVDIFMDRMGRGIGAFLLMLLGWIGIQHPRQVSVVVLGLASLWILLSVRAKKEYIRTVQRRLESRRLDLGSERITISDPATITLLEQAAVGANARQACYALSMLAEAPDFELEPLLRQLQAASSAEVRGKVYELARSRKFPELLETALAEVRSLHPRDGGAIRPAVAYLLSVSPEASQLAAELLDDPNSLVGESALEALASQGEAGRDLVTYEWITRNAAEADPRRRRLAALGVGVRGDQGTESLHRLLEDPDPEVVFSACQAAGTVKNRAYLPAIIRRLAEARLRAAAIDALMAYGARISGSLGDLLDDNTVPISIRRQIPRVLRLIPDQRNVDVLLKALIQPDLSIRMAVLKALNRLRETAPHLDYGAAFVTTQILSEARYYFELDAALESLRTQTTPRPASALLGRSIEDRLRQTIERLFRLLGLRYPPKEIYAAYLAVNRQRAGELSAALEFLDNLLDHDLKRVLLPLLDASGQLTGRGRELFRIQIREPESAIRELIRSDDPWLVACAAATAAELHLCNLAPDIAQAAEYAGKDVFQVAQSALAALA
jgi:ATP/ADP translocase/HEAT repeat protein